MTIWIKYSVLSGPVYLNYLTLCPYSTLYGERDKEKKKERKKEEKRKKEGRRL
jgi:hypothetical protein